MPCIIWNFYWLEESCLSQFNIWYAGDMQTHPENWGKIQPIYVLVLDDIGVSDTNEWFVNQILFEILDERYNTKKLTYFTSNFSMNQLFKKIRNSSKLPAIDVGRIIDRIKALTNNTEIEIKETNHRYLNYK